MNKSEKVVMKIASIVEINRYHVVNTILNCNYAKFEVISLISEVSYQFKCEK